MIAPTLSGRDYRNPAKRENCGAIRNLVGIRGDGLSGDMGEEAGLDMGEDKVPGGEDMGESMVPDGEDMVPGGEDMGESMVPDGEDMGEDMVPDGEAVES